MYLSFRKKELIFKLPEKAVVKPGISHFSENSVNFVDGTAEEIDEVIYCTGLDVNTAIFEFTISDKKQEQTHTRVYQKHTYITAPKLSNLVTFFLFRPTLSTVSYLSYLVPLYLSIINATLLI